MFKLLNPLMPLGLLPLTGLTTVAAINLSAVSAEAFSLVEGSLVSPEQMLEMSVPLSEVSLSDVMELVELVAAPDQILGTLAGQFSVDIPFDLGDVGLPDPGKFEQELDSIFSDKTIKEIGLLDSLFGSRIGGAGSNTLRDTYFQEFLSELASKTATETALSTEAQAQTKENVELAAELAEQSKDLATDSQNQDVSQNILRNISGQIALQQKTDELVYQQMKQSQLTNALQTQVTAEALTQMRASNTAREREQTGASQQAMKGAFLFSIPGVATED